MRDPQAFRTWLEAVPCDGAAAQREALAHLIHPDAFEAICSPRVKQATLAACAVDADDIDAGLRDLRARLEADHGAGFSFVDVFDVR